MDQKTSRALLQHEPRHQLPRRTTPSAWRSALRWRRTTIIWWASVVALPAAVSLYFFSPPTFVASAEVLLSQATASAIDPKMSAVLPPVSFVDGQIKLLESDRVLQRVIDRLGLWHDPEVSEGTLPLGGVLARGSVVPQGREAHRNAQIAAFRERLKVASLAPAPAMRVSYMSADPYKAAAVATAVAEAYVEMTTAELRQEAQQAETHLAQRLTRLQERAATAQTSAVLPTQGSEPNSGRQHMEAALSAHLYGSTLAQYAEAVRGSKQASSEPRIVSAAASSRDDSTFRLGILALALSLGGLIGLGSAIRREAINRPVRSMSDLSAILGAPSLGCVSFVPGRRLFPKRTRARPLLLHDDHDNLRALLLRLRRDANGGGALVLGIASALEGEGKSTIAFNLAALAAEDGERVLLVDMDLHNCTLTNVLAEDGKDSLIEAINERRDLPDAVTHTEHGFDVLGERSLDDGVRPVSVLASQKMDALLSRARSLYDIVICDIPPVLDHADISAMADMLDRFVFVAEWGRTPAPALEQALERSPLVESRLLGTLLNKVPPRP